jgi:hypothetical protein
MGRVYRETTPKIVTRELSPSGHASRWFWTWPSTRRVVEADGSRGQEVPENLSKLTRRLNGLGDRKAIVQLVVNAPVYLPHVS